MSLVQVNYLIKGRPFCSVQFPLHRPLVPTTASCHAFEQYVQKNAFGLVCNAAPCRAASFVIPPTFVPVQSWVFSNHDNRRSTRWKSDLVQGACINHDSSSSSSVLNANTGNGRSRELVITPTGEKPLYLRDCRHFVNLTNGIEALPMLHELNLPYSFVRIQSTACEQQNLEALVAELDANLLLSLALGHWWVGCQASGPARLPGVRLRQSWPGRHPKGLVVRPGVCSLHFIEAMAPAALSRAPSRQERVSALRCPNPHLQTKHHPTTEVLCQVYSTEHSGRRGGGGGGGHCRPVNSFANTLQCW
ncbi:hypothetical protein Vafri_21771 [Volvox africanus]|uniref:Uncharacterized protein n=1 Tax=Volvox africanus TaxID=51714 RepID=A0A8J4BSF0_9CHLO|nr:hypothetical protein Vafri_21771 [Volvox africanus]